MKLLPPIPWLLRARSTEFVVHWETLCLQKAQQLPPGAATAARRVGAFQGSLWEAWRWSRAFGRKFTCGRVQIWPATHPEFKLTA